MRSTISYIAILIFFSLCATAQTKDARSEGKTKEKAPKEKKEKKDPADRINYRPTEMRIGADILSLGSGTFTKNLEKFEANGDIDFHHYLLNLDLGYENNRFDSVGNVSNAFYKTAGQYFKIGVDRSFTIDNPTNSDIFMGFRYARAIYKDELDYSVNDDVWGTGNPTPSNSATARWIELTFGMKVNMTKYIAVGYIWRLKLAPKTNGTDAFESYKIPGYGRTIRNNNLGLNFYAFFRLPVPKAGSKAEKEKAEKLIDDLLTR